MRNVSGYDLTLFFPPGIMSNLDSPYLSIPLLENEIKRRNFSVKSVDLNIEFLKYYITEGSFKKKIDLIVNSKQGNEDLSQYLTAVAYEKFLNNDKNTLSINIIESALRFFPPQIFPENFELNFENILNPGYKNKDIEGFVNSKLDLGDVINTHIIGFSIICVEQLFSAIQLVRYFKAINSECLSVFGGPLFGVFNTAEKEKLIADPDIDLVVADHGEEVLAALISRYKREKDISGLQEHVANQAAGKNNFPITQIKNNNFLYSEPIKFEKSYLIPHGDNIVLPLYVGKGCYWGKCNFCDYTRVFRSNGVFALRPPHAIIEDIKFYVNEYNISRFRLIIDAPLKSHLVELAQKIIQSRLKITYSMFLRVEKQHDDGFYKLLYDSGLRKIVFGVENFIDRILCLMQKGITCDNILKNLEYANGAGCKCIVNQIIDYPTITRSEMIENLNIIKSNEALFFAINPFRFKLSPLSRIVALELAHGISIKSKRELCPKIGIHIPFEREAGITDERTIREIFNMYLDYAQELHNKNQVVLFDQEKNDHVKLSSNYSLSFHGNRLYISTLEGKSISIDKSFSELFDNEIIKYKDILKIMLEKRHWDYEKSEKAANTILSTLLTNNIAVLDGVDNEYR